MEVGGLYWVNAQATCGEEPSVYFYVDERNSFLGVGAGGFHITNAFPVILLEVIHQEEDVYLFRCLTHKGVGERLAGVLAFKSWFMNDLKKQA